MALAPPPVGLVAGRFIVVSGLALPPSIDLGLIHIPTMRCLVRDDAKIGRES